MGVRATLSSKVPRAGLVISDWLFLEGLSRPLLCMHCSSCSASRTWPCTCRRPWVKCPTHFKVGMACRGVNRFATKRSAPQGLAGAAPKRQRCAWQAQNKGQQKRSRNCSQQHRPPIATTSSSSHELPPRPDHNVSTLPKRQNMHQIEDHDSEGPRSSRPSFTRPPSTRPLSSSRVQWKPKATAASRGVLLPLGPKPRSKFG